MTYTGTTITEFFDRFPDEQACLAHIFETRFGDHSPCPRCGGTGGWALIGGTKKYFHRCRRHISILEDTPFYRSNLSLMAWFYALLLFCNSSTGMRSSFLRRQLGIGVKSAHRMCNIVRTHMAAFEPARRLGGEGKLVHIDEALVSHVANGCRQSPHIVMGIECEGEVICGMLQDRTMRTVTAAIAKFVRPGSTLVTDCHLAYSSLAREGWEHISINHARAFHNFAGMTNNPIEVDWSVLKRTLRLYGRFSPDNLWLYLAEIQFRYNRRRAVKSPFLELVGSFPGHGPEELLQRKDCFHW
ncbi:IS1595 family transposase [Aurantiacibacter hainanensis]|uniref:IS1595 family transposase n=1 Tax=Aurantiacibacter hainanensis TaxID=3076114 RepID=UPI0030C77B9D